MKLLLGRHTLGKERLFSSFTSHEGSEVQSKGERGSAGPIHAPQGPFLHPGLFMLQVGGVFSVPPTASMKLRAALCAAGVRAT